MTREAVETLRAALVAARSQILWWADNHGCCKGAEDDTIDVIDIALAKTEGTAP